MRLLLTGGGTGGHVTPALAIADIVKANEPDTVVAYAGTPRGIENKIVPKEGYPLYLVEIQGLKRSLSPANLKTAYLALTSPGKAKKFITEFKPDIVVGTGGYVCWPVMKAAADMGIPTALHEANSIPGIAVKMLAPYVDEIMLNFEATAERMPKYSDKLVHVGNPLRSNFASIGKAEARRQLGLEADGYSHFVLSFGGSMGAEHINDAVLEMMRDYIAAHPEVLHVHATGSIEFEAATEKYKAFGLDKVKNAVLLEFIYDMPLRMAAADVVICRAGAMTISELAIAKKSAIIIPSPNVTENHQYNNAKVLADRNAAILLEEKDLTGGSLAEKANLLLTDEAARAEIENAVAQFYDPDTGKKIYGELKKLIAVKKNSKK